MVVGFNINSPFPSLGQNKSFNKKQSIFNIILLFVVSLMLTVKSELLQNTKCTGGYTLHNGGRYRCGCWKGSCWSKCPYLNTYEWCLTTRFYSPGRKNNVGTCEVNGDCTVGFQCARGPSVCRWQKPSIREELNRARDAYVTRRFNKLLKLNKRKRDIDDLPNDTEIDIQIECNEKYKKSRAIFNNRKRENTIKSSIQRCIRHYRRAYEKLGYLSTTDPSITDYKDEHSETTENEEIILNPSPYKEIVENSVEKRIAGHEKMLRNGEILDFPAYDLGY